MSDQHISTDAFNAISKNTLVEHLGIEFIEVSKDSLKATMPVDHRTCQPYGILHGGASVALAETLGSIGAAMHTDPKTQLCVGLEINANHIKSVKKGNEVIGEAKPIHIGKKTHIWEIRITNKDEQLVCVSRITMAILDRK
ncbi:MAG: hotdog fold thioesterase [Cyclobacteriaceae bacterium]